MPTIEASGLTKVYRTYRKERGLWGSVKGLVWRRYDETRAADHVSFQIEEGELTSRGRGLRFESASLDNVLMASMSMPQVGHRSELFLAIAPNSNIRPQRFTTQRSR